MHYATILWAGIAAAALVLSTIHTAVWALDRRALANFAFAISAVGLTGVAWCEIGMMSAHSPSQWGWWVRWFQIPHFFMLIGMLTFIRLYLGTGRIWLLGTIT